MLFSLAEWRKYWHFMLCLGLKGGFSAALIHTAALSCVSHWSELAFSKADDLPKTELSHSWRLKRF
jgi:hypothetical protein